MFDITFDLRQFEQRARQLGAVERQLPYALAIAVNETAKDVEKAVVEEIEGSFDRPTPFTVKSTGIWYAKKTNLKAKIFIKRIQAGYLARNWTGGTRPPKKRLLPVPGKVMPLNAHGNMKRGIIARTAKRKDTFIGSPAGGKLPLGLWQRSAKKSAPGGEKAPGGLQLLALMTGPQKYERRFDFDGAIRRTATDRLPHHLAGAVKRAMETAR